MRSLRMREVCVMKSSRRKENLGVGKGGNRCATMQRENVSRKFEKMKTSYSDAVLLAT
jgi:hypothetical protein